MNLTEFIDTMLEAFPFAEWDVDGDSQVIIHTGLKYNPRIPEGESLILPFE